MRRAIRWMRTVVLPVPAPATTSIGPETCSMACCCCGSGRMRSLEFTLETATDQEHTRLELRKMGARLGTRTLTQVIGSVICLAFTWKLTYGLGATEFSGGRITGPLLAMSDFAMLLFLLSTILILWLPRTTALFTALACLLCFPICFLFLAPGPFRRIAGGVWSVPLQSNFALTIPTMNWALILVVTLGVSIWNLALVGPKVWATQQ